MKIKTRWLPLFVVVSAFCAIYSFGAAADSLAEKNKNSGSLQNYKDDYRSLVNLVISDVGVLKKSTQHLLNLVPDSCLLDQDHIFYECHGIIGVSKIAIDPGPLGAVTMRLTSPANCADIEEIIRARYGKGNGVVTEGDCDISWKLNKYAKGVYINLRSGNKPGKPYLILQFATELGP